jgi:hypothetical protein
MNASSQAPWGAAGSMFVVAWRAYELTKKVKHDDMIDMVPC